MRKITILAALVASVLFITGCASQCNTPCEKEVPCAHKDLKGEVK